MFDEDEDEEVSPPLECEECGSHDAVEPVDFPRTWEEPASRALLCAPCRSAVQNRRRLTRNERLQAAADAGRDTWEEYRGER